MFATVAVVWVLVLILVVVTLFAGVKTVSQGQVWTVERFGAYTRMLQPGLNFVLPYVDRVGRKLNVQEQVVEIPEQSVITRDNATVAVDGIIYYRVMEPEKAAYQVTNLTLALTTLAMTNIRAVIGEMELDANSVLAGAHQHRAADHPGRRDDAVGRKGEPRRNPQDRAAREPDPRDEPADDGGARTACGSGPRRGRAAGGHPAR